MSTSPAEIAASSVVRSPFGLRLGAETVEAEPDRVVVRMPFTEQNVTVGDVVHGGAIATLIDIAATGAAWSAVDDPSAYRGTTIGLSISFLAAARSTELRAEARVRRRGKSVTFVEVSVRDATGTEFATAQVTYKLSAAEPKRSPAEIMASLFTDKSVEEQQALLATLERSGAQIYEAWAKAAPNEEIRRALLEAARRELENAEALEKLA